MMSNTEKILGLVMLVAALGLGAFVIFWTDTAALAFNIEFRIAAGIILVVIALYIGWMMWKGTKSTHSY